MIGSLNIILGGEFLRGPLEPGGGYLESTHITIPSLQTNPAAIVTRVISYLAKLFQLAMRPFFHRQYKSMEYR